MKTYQVLLIGGCMISGYNLAPIYSLPVLIDREFRDGDIRMNLTADSNNATFEGIYLNLNRLTLDHRYDFIIIQFLNSSLIPKIGLESKLQRYTLGRIISDLLHNLESRMIPFSWRVFFRVKVLRVKSDNSYQKYLKQCIEVIQKNNPDRTVFLLSPIAPSAKAVQTIRSVFIEGRQNIMELAVAEKIHVIDIWSPLEKHQPEEIYLEDGYHLTALGQRTVAREIVDSLKKVISQTEVSSQSIIPNV